MSQPTDPSTSNNGHSEDPVPERRDAMLRGIGSWNLEGAAPSGVGLNVVQKYVDGETSIDGAIAMLKAEYPTGGSARG